MRLKLRENADINTVTGISDIIIDSINKKWDNIRDFNSIIVNLNEEGYEDLVPVIESILEDENRNVGKLQQLVEIISPTASSIDDGKQEAIDELDNIEVKEEMKLSENFSNLPKESDVEVDVDLPMGKAIEDHADAEKTFEDALKENEKLAKETIPKEGETGKKVTSKALKAMHLSESLFDEEDSSVNFNIGDRVQVHFEDSPDKIAEIIDIINDDVIEVEEFDSTGSPYRIDRYYKQQLTKLDESLLTDSANVKMDIAREQIQRFKEGKMPKDWKPEDYVNDLIKKNHLTKEEGDELLSEGILTEELNSIEDCKKEYKVILNDLKKSYYSLNAENSEDSIEGLKSALVKAKSLYDYLTKNKNGK